MKETILAVILAASAAVAFAGNSNGDIDIDTNVGPITAGGANITANGLGGKNLSPSADASVGPITNVAGGGAGGSAEQGQKQGQAQGQHQSAKASAVAKQGMTNSWSFTQLTPEQAASAASFVAQVASSCGGTMGGSGQAVQGGGLLGFSFEFYDCKIMREASFLISLGLVDAGLQHVARNIERVAETLEATHGEFKVLPNRPSKKQWTKDLNKTSGRK